MRNLCLALVLCLPLAAQAQPAQPAPTAQFLNPNSFDLGKLLPEPPTPDSLAGRAELELSLQVQGWRSPEMIAHAQKVDGGSVWDFAAVLGPDFNKGRLPFCRGLIAQVEDLTSRVTTTAKLRFARKRPPFADSRIHPCVKVSDTGSYPSGHASQIFTQALLLAELFPAQREALLDFARKSSWTRIIAGAHFPTDVEGGRLLAEGLIMALKQQPSFREALSKAQTEVGRPALKQAS